jgi:hypothetical protein
LLDHPAIQEFRKLEQLELEPLLTQPAQHTKYLGCQSCFPNRQFYFLSFEEITAHITGFIINFINVFLWQIFFGTFCLFGIHM